MKSPANLSAVLERSSQTETTSLPSADNSLSYLSCCLMKEAGVDPKNATIADSTCFDVCFEDLVELVQVECCQRFLDRSFNFAPEESSQQSVTGQPEKGNWSWDLVSLQSTVSLPAQKFGIQRRPAADPDSLRELVKGQRKGSLLSCLRDNRNSDSAYPLGCVHSSSTRKAVNSARLPYACRSSEYAPFWVKVRTSRVLRMFLRTSKAVAQSLRQLSQPVIASSRRKSNG